MLPSIEPVVSANVFAKFECTCCVVVKHTVVFNGIVCALVSCIVEQLNSRYLKLQYE